MTLYNRLIVALDFPSINKANKLILNLGETITHYKVGMELFYGAGKDIIDILKERNKQIFLDLKLHDIPNTVGNTVSVLSELGADMINVHASGGLDMMQKAVSSAKEFEDRTGQKAPNIIAVTVLTSMNEMGWEQLNNKLTINEQVIELAKLAKEAGMNGVVASPQEAAQIKKACGNDFLIVTPGIRPLTSKKDDQNRIATPENALKAGATHLVIGRPITQAENPKEAARKILDEMVEIYK